MLLYIIILIIIIGFLLGYYLGFIIFHKVIYKGPDSNIIRKKIFKFNNKYYKFKPILCIGL